MSPLVLALGDPRAADSALVGPKAAHLSALAGSHPVPPGFCLTAEAYRRAERDGRIDGDLHHSIAEAYALLMHDGAAPVAVRSSALDEDGPTASFAGQHETVLNVVGFDAVLAAVDRTWRSLRSEAALAYRRAHGLPETGLALAVLVQRMVRADASGVAFSVDPVSGRDDHVVVNASWGLGESMVNGTVTPDTWHMDKATLAIVDERIAEKERMSVTVEGAAREVAVPGFMRTRPSLEPSQLNEVAALARDLEGRQGWPVDVEWAFQDGRLHLLQCRPVTHQATTAEPEAAAADLPDPWVEPDDAGRFWERDRVHFTASITVLDAAFIKFVCDHGLNYGMDRYGLPYRSHARRFWTHHYAHDEKLETTDEKRSEAAFTAALDDLDALWRERWRPQIDEARAFWGAFDLESASLAALVAHLDATMEWLLRLWKLHFEIVIPLGRAKGAFATLHDELFEPDTPLRAHELLQGIDTLTTSVGRRQWALGAVVAAVPSARAIFETRPASDVLSALAHEPEARPVLDALTEFLAEYGHRTTMVTLSGPTLAEDPTPVVRMLQDALARPDVDLVASHAELSAERERRLAEVRAALRGYPEPVRSEFERLLATAEAATRLGEDHNYLIDFTSTAAVRYVFLEFGRRLAAAGVLEMPEDVVHLDPDEIRATAVALPRLDRRPLVAERRAELARYAQIDPPDTLGTRPDADPAASWGDGAARRVTLPRNRILTGTAGSAGIARGPARVLHSLADAARLQPGEVLVTPTTSQPWMPLFATAIALVTDTGGILSHTAVVAREFRLPAVVGVRDATRMLRDGMLLEVDGARGLVRVVDEG